jgi:hypothetical protein
MILLTLIRAAGGVYDFQYFEDILLSNVLSSELTIQKIGIKDASKNK